MITSIFFYQYYSIVFARTDFGISELAFDFTQKLQQHEKQEKVKL